MHEQSPQFATEQKIFINFGLLDYHCMYRNIFLYVSSCIYYVSIIVFIVLHIFNANLLRFFCFRFFLFFCYLVFVP